MNLNDMPSTVYELGSTWPLNVIADAGSFLQVQKRGKTVDISKNSLYIHPYFPGHTPVKIRILIPMLGHKRNSEFNITTSAAMPEPYTIIKATWKQSAIKVLTLSQVYTRPDLYAPIYPELP
jgi:hypothetical protein